MPALYVKREERGIVPASRTRREFFEVGVQRPTGEIELLHSETPDANGWTKIFSSELGEPSL